MELVPVVDPDPEESPDVWEMFRHYDRLYFRGALVDAGFAVQWGSPRISGPARSFGSCSFGDSNTITLYEPILRSRTDADLKAALLHLMIHAIIYVKHGRKGIWDHGPVFRDWMDAINSCSAEDHLKPSGGYCITTIHDFSSKKSAIIQGFLWKCESCGNTLVRATKLGRPSDSCCIENAGNDCGNMLCYWHIHKMNCGGRYEVSKPPKTPSQKKVPKGMQMLLTGTSEICKSQGIVQESDSDVLQENSSVSKQAGEGKPLSLLGGRNAKSLGSSSSKKTSKTNMPDDSQKAIALPAAPLRKLKLEQEFVASEKHERFSIGSCNDAKSPRSTTSKKAGKRNMPEDSQQSIALPDVSLKKLKLKQEFVASEKHGVFSLGCCSNTKPLGSGNSGRAGQQHRPESVEKSSVPPAAPQEKLKREKDLVASDRCGVSFLGSCGNEKAPRSSSTSMAGKRNKPEDVEHHVAFEKHEVAKLPGSSTTRKEGKLHKPGAIQKASVVPDAHPRKLKQDSVVTEKNEHFSLMGYRNAKVLDSFSSKKAQKQGEHDNIQKPIVLPAVPQSILKRPNKTQSVKAGKQHKPEDFQTTIVQSAVPQSTLKQSKHAAPGRQKTKDKSSKFARKEYAVLPAVPQSILKRPNKTQSVKAGKQHKPEDFQTTIVQSAVPQSTLKQSKHAAPGRQKTKDKSSKFARKEYAVVSVWQNIYESEASSGSTEPLVNKRTERRKRERARVVQRTYLRSRKRSTSGISSIKTQPPEKGLSQQAKPTSPCLDMIVLDPANQVVTRASGDQSQPRVPCMDMVIVPPVDQVMIQVPGDQFPPTKCVDIVVSSGDPVMTQTPVDLSQPLARFSVAADQVVPLQTAGPPGLAPSYQSTNLDVICISDDD